MIVVYLVSKVNQSACVACGRLVITDSARAPIVVSGDLDIATSAAMSDQVSDRLRDRSQLLVLDLTLVTFMDCAGLGALIRLRNQANAAGIQLVLRGPGDAVDLVLRATTTRSAFTLEEDDSGSGVARVGRPRDPSEVDDARLAK